MNGTRRSTEQRRAEIADGALRIIGERGIAALTVNALARELRLTGGALYRHFSSTEEILEAVASRAAELLDAATPPPELEPLEWIRQLAITRSTTVGGHAGLSRLLLSEQFTLALPPTAAARLAAAVTKTRAGVRGALVAAQARGEVRDDFPAEALVPIVIGTIQMMALRGVPAAAPHAPGSARTIVDTLLGLLAAPPSRSGTVAPKPAAKARKR